MRKVSGASAVAEGVGEDILQDPTEPGSRQYFGVVQVNAVGVAAIGVDHQGAVTPGQRLANRTRSAAARFGAGTNAAHAQLFVRIDITVIGQDVTGGLR
ncbi:hypothetical protein D3C76_1182140 [compost metagenome]